MDVYQNVDDPQSYHLKIAQALRFDRDRGASGRMGSLRARSGCPGDGRLLSRACGPGLARSPGPLQLRINDRSVHVTVAAVAVTGLGLFLLRLVGHKRLGRQQHAGD